MKKLLYFIFILACISVSCSNELKINNVTVYPESVTLTEGDSVRISAVIDFSGGNYNEPDLIVLDWSSDNEDVATVDSSGYIRTRSAGTANVSVKCYDKMAQCAVTVLEKTDENEENEVETLQ